MTSAKAMAALYATIFFLFLGMACGKQMSRRDELIRGEGEVIVVSETLFKKKLVTLFFDV